MILGCSFAALEYLYRTARLRWEAGREFQPGEITVVEPLAAHPYIPLIHEVVSGVRTPEAVQFDTAAFCRAIGVRLVHQVATRLDPAARRVHVADGSTLDYDRLLIAVGSVPDRPAETDDTVFAAKFLDEGLRLRYRILALDAEGLEPIRVVVIGGGITGVEWSAELAGRGIDAIRVAVTLVTRDSRLLTEFPSNVARHALRRLERLDVRVVLDSETAAVRDGGVVLRDRTERIPADVVVWAAGVRPNPVLARFGLPLTARGHVPVTPHLEVAGYPGVYAAGDAMRIIENGREWPTAVRAIEAIWQGRISPGDSTDRSLPVRDAGIDCGAPFSTGYRWGRGTASSCTSDAGRDHRFSWRSGAGSSGRTICACD